MSPVSMRKVELFVLKSDMDLALERIGEARCFQIAEPRRRPKAEPAAQPESATKAQSKTEGARPQAASLERLRAIRRSLNLPFPETVPAGTRLPGPKEEAALAAMAQRIADFDAAEQSNAARVARSREALEEAKAFAGLSLPFRELDHLSFLALRIGHIDTAAISGLSENLGERALIVPVNANGMIVAATTKKGRFALDTELGRAGFKPKQFAPDFAGLPSELPEVLERELVRLEAARFELERRRAELRAELAPLWSTFAACYAVAQAVEEVKSGLESSELVYRLEGWVPRDRVRALSADLDRATSGRVALRAFTPREIETVRSGEEEVPVLLKRRFFVSSFERLVVAYGTPLYGTVDPTPFVAFFFILLFSIMFGDLGQGFLILLAGIILRKELIPSLKRWKVFGPILVAAGLGSMTMGFLDGSVFCNDRWLVPLTRSLSGVVLGRPVDRFLSLMPQGGVAKILAFFGFTLGLGVVVNSLGLVINIVNKLKLGRTGEAIFSKTGVAGALFFWWIVGLALRVLFGGGAAWFDALGLGLPLLALIFEEPLGRIADGVRRGEEEGDGAFAFAIKGFVAVMESVSYFLSNSLSFLRVGAFALSHIVLSFIVFSMGDMIRERSTTGVVWEILVVLAGNAIILVLEGMIVAIQVIRLQYYEFLSKFLTETGRPFSPFRFEYRKE